MTVVRVFWFVTGFAALGFAALGLVLPLLPTTPFVLVAAFAFARSSPRFHRWLLAHRIFGPIIVNWREHGAISRRAKVFSAVSMAAVFLLSIVLGVAPWVLAVQAAVLGGAAAFVLSRPLPPAD